MTKSFLTRSGHISWLTLFAVIASFSLSACVTLPEDEIEEDDSSQSKSSPRPSSSPAPTSTPRPTSTPAPTSTPGGGVTIHTLQRTSPTEIYRPTGAGLENVKGGDILEIPAGDYYLIDLGNFRGEPGKPVTIRNVGGLVRTNLFRIRNYAQYVKLQGNGDPALEYGIKVDGTGLSAVGLAVVASDVEVSNIECVGSDVGIMAKSNPDPNDPRTIYPNYVMKNIYIHHNYLHDIHGEGMYIGHTYPNADPYHGNLTPIRLDSVEISHNLVERTDWDGIQLSNARANAKIHHNTVKDFGLLNLGSQQAGIILGGNTNGEIYDNVVQRGTGNGIEVFGYGLIDVYRNRVEDSGVDGTVNGQDAVYCNDHRTTIETNPKQQTRFYENTIVRPQRRGAIRVAADFGNTLPGSITSNTFTIPGAGSDWLTRYLIAPAGTTISGNVLSR